VVSVRVAAPSAVALAKFGSNVAQNGHENQIESKPAIEAEVVSVRFTRRWRHFQPSEQLYTYFEHHTERQALEEIGISEPPLANLLSLNI
jgi:hypothetical protein